MRNKKLLCVDFDGVIHSYSSGWVSPTFIPDPPVPGAIRFLHDAINRFNVCIFSSRSSADGGILAMSTWLEYWTRRDEDINTPEGRNHIINRLCLPYCIKGDYVVWPTSKPPAHLSIDDRAWTFRGTWPPMSELDDFKPWNKQ
jgi:hypothetical protein